MKRLFYFSVGAAAGVYASYRFQRAAQAWTPAALAKSAVAAGASVRDMADQVRARAAEREAQLRGDLRLDEPGDIHVDERTRETH